MAKKRISREKIINAFLFTAFEKSAGATSLQDIASFLGIKKASLYNHFSSRDEMYKATLDYCKDYLSGVNFLPDEMSYEDKFVNINIFEVFKIIEKRYIRLYETEPLFQIYVFYNTEQFFNKEASEIADSEYTKIKKAIVHIMNSYITAGSIETKTLEEISVFGDFFCHTFLQSVDLYIMHKKEVLRQNPESGVGSLFALPPDTEALDKILSTLDYILQKAIVSLPDGK